MVKLLTEVVHDIKPIVESVEGGPKKYFIEGIFLQANVLNKNGRVYSRDILQNEVARYTKDFILPKRSLGELGHPDSPTVNQDRASHYITDLKEDGNNWVGKAKILDTPYGKIVKTFIDEGITNGVSSRGMGTLVERNGVNHVQEDYKLVGVDIVHDPSAHDAFVQGVMESKEWILDIASGEYRLIEEIQKDIRRASKVNLEEAILTAFNKFIGSI